MSEVTPPPPAANPQAPPPEITGFPAWIKAFAALVAALLIFALVRVGPTLSSAIAVERAHRLTEHGKHAEAARLLSPVVAKYPDAVDVRLDLAEACADAKDAVGAIGALSPLEGTRVSDEVGQRADQIAAKIEHLLPKHQQVDRD